MNAHWIKSIAPRLALAALGCALLAGCRTATQRPFATPTGDEIIVAGQRFHTGTRVVTWMEPDGYNAYRGVPPFALRLTADVLNDTEAARVKEHGWDLPALQKVVDQFVVHYDATGLSRICFNALRGPAGLSVHFMLDVDGTIYQTLDLQERALHATIANSRSIGIEIANIGAYPPAEAKPLDDWYRRDEQGAAVIAVPARIREPGIRTKDFVGRPVRPTPVRGALQGKELVQYDFTPEQYAALAKLTAAICRVFPRITCDFPHDESGRLITRKLPDDELAKYHGILGHYHIQENKVDPGPAFQWRRLIDDAKKLRP